MLRQVILAGTVLLWGGLAWAETPLETVEAVYQTVSREQVLDGMVEAINEATITAQTSGQVVDINFDVGDFVPEGAVVMRLRGREQRAAVDEALARYNQAEAEYLRIRDVFERKLVSKAEFDRAEANYRAAKASLERAREQAGYTEVRAPFGGVVTERFVDLGDVAQVGQPLISGVSLAHLRVRVDVPESLIPDVRRESHARIMTASGAGESIEVDHFTIFPYADPVSSTVRLRLPLPEGTGGDGQGYDLLPGMLVKVAFTTGRRERLVVPQQAVAYRSEVTAVYVLREDGSAVMRQVRLGYKSGDVIEILAGLDAGERVALDPVAAGVYIKERQARGDAHE